MHSYSPQSCPILDPTGLMSPIANMGARPIISLLESNIVKRRTYERDHFEGAGQDDMMYKKRVVTNAVTTHSSGGPNFTQIVTDSFAIFELVPS